MTRQRTARASWRKRASVATRPALAALAAAALLAGPPRAARAAADAGPASAAFDSVRSLMSRGETVAAESLATGALRRAESAAPADSGRMARALEAIGAARFERRALRDSAARQALERAIAIRERLHPRDTLALAAAEIALAKLLTESGQAAAAVAHLDRALTAAGAPGAGPVLAAAWLARGQAHRRMREPEAALAALERALDLGAGAGGEDSRQAVTILNETGGALMDLWRYDDARASLERALATGARALPPDDPALVAPLNLLAGLEYRAGDLGRSLELLRRALHLAVRAHGARSVRAQPMRYNIGLRLLDLGDYREARAEFDQALAVFEDAYGAGHSRTENVRMMRGVAAAALGDTAPARRDVERALTALERGAARDPMLPHGLRWRAYLAALRGEHAAARADVERALALDRASGAPALETLATLHEMDVFLARLSGDAAPLARVVAAEDPVPADGSLRRTVAFAKWTRARAEALALLGRRDEAWTEALVADDVERERLRLNARVLPERQALSLQDEISAPLDLLVELARGGGPGRRHEAWDRLARWRGTVAAEVAGRREPPAGAAPELHEAHRRWVNAQRAHAGALIAASVAAGDARVESRLRALRDSAEAAERAYARRAGPEPWFPVVVGGGLAPLLAGLERDEALVGAYELASGTDSARLVAFVGRGAGAVVELVDLGPSRELEGLLAPWRAALGAPPAADDAAAERECRALGERVRRRTWDALAPALAGRGRVYLVPDGPLRDLPWAALPAAGRGYWIEGAPLLVELDAEMAHARARAARPGSGLLALGGPEFDAAPAAGADAGPVAAAWRASPPGCSTAEGLRLRPLPGALEEAVDVVRGWPAVDPGSPAVLLAGSDATEGALREGAPGRRVLHLATHGIVWGDSCRPASRDLRGVGAVEALAGPARRRPARAGGASASAPAPGRAAPPPGFRASRAPWLGREVWLALAGANRAWTGAVSGDDGLLTAGDVSTLDLRGLDWVVLSACHSGAGEAWPHEGVTGMRRAFRMAGATAVIASEWAVGDRSAREWMGALYRARGAGARSAAAAARAAALEVLAARRATGRSTHPFWWAAFEASGS